MREFRGVPVWRVLAAALLGNLSRVFVVGMTSKGEIYAAGSHRKPLHDADLAAFDRKFHRGDYDVSREELDRPSVDGSTKERLA